MDPESLPAPLQCCVIICAAFMAHLAPAELITEGVGGASAGLQHKHCWINLAGSCTLIQDRGGLGAERRRS